MLKLLSLFLLAGLLATGVAAAQKSLRLLSYNIRNSKGMDGKTDHDRTVAVLQKIDADVIGLQELDSATRRSGSVAVLQVLADKTGLHAVFGAALPYQDGKYGIGMLSKEKPLQHYTVPLPGQEEARVLLVVEFANYVVFNTHLSLTEADRLASVVIINEQAARFAKPLYLMGGPVHVVTFLYTLILSPVFQVSLRLFAKLRIALAGELPSEAKVKV